GVQLTRFAQHISKKHLAGVYAGEAEKIAYLELSMAQRVIAEVVAPAAQAGRIVAILCEEWQTARFCTILHDALQAAGLRQHAVIVWNANNVFGFEGIDWAELSAAAGIT